MRLLPLIAAATIGTICSAQAQFIGTHQWGSRGPRSIGPNFSKHLAAGTMAEIIGNVRVRALSPYLVRLEEKGPHGFEDRVTFTVVNRPLYHVPPKIQFDGIDTLLTYPHFRVLVPRGGQSLRGVQVQTVFGRSLYEFKGQFPKPAFLPPPSERANPYVMADHPRIVPPTWGATPAPLDVPGGDQSGWDTRNDSPDLYVFVPGDDGYKQLRKDFLSVTGPSPMLPLWAFGFWDSRWYPYDEELALSTIDEYHRRGFPLDGFVVDTDWRVNGSDGYSVAKKYFPDMARFIRRAHEKNVHLMFNDHPEPIDLALSPKELTFRWAGLSSLLTLGMDVWWYDRNWSTHLREPAPGIAAEVWGQRLYHDMTAKARPNERPMIMSNFQGIDNGVRNYAPHPAGHRYPMMWTGDTGATFGYLEKGLANGVDMGLLALHPYVNEDLGGHWATPTPELYVRYLEFGAFAPIMRIHCTRDQDRHPWKFGADAERIVRDYVKLRYRLIPTLYSAARRSFEDGTPIMRRCDLFWPQYPEAADNQQFLFGDDLLVAPQNTGADPAGTPIDSKLLKTPDGHEGLSGQYFLGRELQGKPVLERVDSKILFDWSGTSPDPKIPQENYSVRWTGTLGPVPETGRYVLGTKTDDGVRLFVDGKLIIDHWIGEPSTDYEQAIQFEKGSTHSIVMEYFQAGGGADAALKWALPSEAHEKPSRKVWLPPGQWVDVWTGARLTGPKTILVENELWHTPLFARSGGLIITAPQRSHVEEQPWNDICIEAYVPQSDGAVSRELYEDDGHSTEYLSGKFRKTVVELSRRGSKLRMQILPAKGDFEQGTKSRAFTLRFHLPKGGILMGSGLSQVAPNVDADTHMPLLGPGSAARSEETVYEYRVSTTSTHVSSSAEFEMK